MARELIAKHGDDVGDVLQAKIDELMTGSDFDQLVLWFVVRNCVTMSLQSGQSGATLQ